MTQTMHLQNIGTVPAQPLSTVKAGDTLVWNFGIRNEVISIAAVTPKTVELVVKGEDGRTYTQRKRAATLVCVASR